MTMVSMGFDNATFWEQRYRSNMALGSGMGSRGEFLTAKRRIVSDVIARLRPRSILDVGCGDLEVTRGLAFEGAYIGIDLSRFIIERNHLIRPDWDFVQGDFLSLARPRDLEADLVLCLDVLLHQHMRESYRAFIGALLDASRLALVVNGFDTLPRPRTRSPNVAYHEPITKTLRDCGVETAELLATFRRTAILLVHTPRYSPGETPGSAGASITHPTYSGA